MPKTHNNLWEQVVAWDNLHGAYLDARKGKRYTSGVMRYAENLEENLHDLHNHLIWKTWRPSPFREFIVKEPKLRLIQAPCFADRVAHHALHRVIEPLFDRKFVYDSFACRTGKGNVAAAYRLSALLRSAHARWGKVFALKMDVSRYFPSVDHDTLLRLLGRTIRDRNTLWMCETVIRDSGYDGRGIPIGALTSQLFANVYLNSLDHFIKDDLGVMYALRYMDDAILLGESRNTLRTLLESVRGYLADVLHLALNPKTAILSVVQGIYFAGYRHFGTHRLPRKANVKRARKRFAALAKMYARGEVALHTARAMVMSFLGYMKHCNSYHTTTSELGRLVLVRNGDLYA